MYVPPKSALSTPGPNTFGMEAKDPAKETVAGGPKSPDQKGKENDPVVVPDSSHDSRSGHRLHLRRYRRPGR